MMDKSLTKIRLNEEQLEALGNKLVIPTLDDVLAGRASEEVIRLYAGIVGVKLQRKEPLSEKEQQALAHVNLQIFKGEDANTAYGIIQGNRRKNDAGEEKAIAFHVWRLINSFDYKASAAIREIAECKIGGMYRAYDTVLKIYYKHKEEIFNEAQALIKTPEIIS
jgi:hypothetical protein